MRVFVSWSGERSKMLAEALCEWLRRVIQRCDPWMSVGGIQAGTRWALEIAVRLEDTDFGIICVTRENKTRPWLMYEAGALSKKGSARVVPYLLAMEMHELEAPLDQFHAARADRNHTLRMVQSINTSLGASALMDADLLAVFDTWWPVLEEKIKAIPKSEAPAPEPPSGEELLQLVLKKLDQLERTPRGILSNQDVPSAEHLRLLMKIAREDPYKRRFAGRLGLLAKELAEHGLIQIYTDSEGKRTYSLTKYGADLLQRWSP